MEDKKYRHEYKYQIGLSQYLSIKQRIKTVMKPDPHTNSDGKYIIRSIYFDNFNDKVVKEKIAGVQKKEKFRIRYYNNDFSFIQLEKKIKHNQLCLKLKSPLTEEECRMILNGQIEFMKNHKEGLIQELYCKMKSQLLRPRVLVSYVREPYIYEAGNVRVTFDSEIRSTLWHPCFLEPIVYDTSVMDYPSQMILEIKYDEYLPEIISHLVQTDFIRQQSYSKYVACRRFG